jgi:hypothetical protein
MTKSGGGRARMPAPRRCHGDLHAYPRRQPGTGLSPVPGDGMARARDGMPPRVTHVIRRHAPHLAWLYFSAGAG